MKKTRFTAIFLCLTTLFALFTGGVYAQNGESVYIEETTLVIKDGKVISGDKSLIDSGIVVIGDDASEGAPSADEVLSADTEDGSAQASPTEDSFTEETEEADKESARAPVKDNSAVVGAVDKDEADNAADTIVTPPDIAPNAINPDVPTISAKDYRYLGAGNYCLGYDTDILSDFGTLYWSPLLLAEVQMVKHPEDPNLAMINYQTTDYYSGDGGPVTICRDRQTGYTGMMFDVEANKTFKLTGTSTNKITVSAKSNARSSTISLSTVNASVPMFRVKGTNAVLEMNYVIIQDSRSSGNGAGIYVGASGHAKLTNCTINDCDTTANGGAIYVENGGRLTLNAVTIQNCNAANGGAIYLAGSATLSFTNVKIIKNSATNGGGMYINNGFSATVSDTDDLVIGGSDANKNTATKGGGVYVNSGTVTLNNVQVTYNTASVENGSGGGMYIAGGNVTVNGSSKINNNTAYNHGGAIRVAGGSLTVSGNSQVNNNKLEQYVEPATVNLSSGAKYKGVGNIFTSNGYGENGTWTSYHTNGRLVDGNAKFYASTCVYFGQGSNTAYIVFDYGENKPITLTSIKIYMFNGNGVNKAMSTSIYYPNSIVAYLSDSEVYSSVTDNDKVGNFTPNNSTETTLGSEGLSNYFLNRKEYTLTSSSDKSGRYLILKFNKNTSWLFCSDIEINGYYTPKPVAATTYGGGIYNEGQATVSNGTVSANTATYGGGVYNTGSLGISGGTIGSNVNSTQGGGVYNTGSVTMSGGTISNNTVTAHGGGVRIDDGASFVMTGGTISGNKAGTGGYGGAIHSGTGAVFSMSDGTISGNQANVGAGIATGGSTITLSGGTVTGNTATLNGGGVYLNTNSHVTLSGATVSSNTANSTTEGGGGFWVHGGTLTVSSGTVTGNTGFMGGGIYAVENNAVRGTLEITGGTISNNNATCGGDGGGGGIYARQSDVTIGAKGSTVGPAITGNGGNRGSLSTAAYDGGAIYCTGSDITINSGEITNNRGAHSALYFVGTVQATMNGGKISNNSDGGVFLNGVNVDFIMNGGEISGNTLGKTGLSHGSQNYGGAGICSYNGADVTINGGKISGNTNYKSSDITTEDFDSIKNGGGIAMIRKTTSNPVGILAVTGGEISGNESVNGNGGGIYVEEGGTLNINAAAGKTATVSGNEAVFGGGVYINGTGADTKLYINGAGVSGNSATAGGGGGIYMYSCKGIDTTAITVTNSVFDDNHAKGEGYDGGGIYCSYADLDLSNSVISDNTATEGKGGKNGGGVYFDREYTLTVNGCQFNGNQAYGWGGGMYLCNKAEGTVRDCTFDGNVARQFGGAILVYNTVDLSVSNSYFGNNKAYIEGETTETGGSGGAIGITDDPGRKSTLTLSDSYIGYLPVQTASGDGSLTVAPNEAYYWGGGLCVNANCEATISGNLYVCNNEAGNNGGGMFFANGSTISFGTGTYTVSNNSAEQDGGGIWTATDLTVSNLTLEGNNAARNGGGMYVSGDTNADISYTSFDSNQATNGSGGGLATADTASATAEYTLFGKNQAANGGGVAVLGASSVELINSKVGCLLKADAEDLDDVDPAPNCATTQGGGIFVAEGSTVSFHGNVPVCNNRAGYDAGYILVSNGAKGGGMYFAAGSTVVFGESATDIVTVSDNVATEGGGGIYTAQSFDVYNLIMTNNKAASGGGVYVDNATVNIDNTGRGETYQISHNEATNGNGGGILVTGENGSLTFKNGYVKGNTANGSFNGGTAKVASTEVNGTGGGVAVFDGGSFALTGGAIYGNTASVAGNDVFANGLDTKLTLPAPNAMTVSDDNYKNGLWWEDYMAGDTSYASGLNGDSRLVDRYAKLPVSVRAYTSTAEGQSPSGQYINTDGEFVSITFNVKKYTTGSITITAPTVADKSQLFVFTLEGESNYGDNISLSVSLGQGETVTVAELLPGNYTVSFEGGWSWRYSLTSTNLDGVSKGTAKSVAVTIVGENVGEVHRVVYGASVSNNKWLTHNTDATANVPTLTAVAAFDMAEAKRAYVL